MDPAKREEFYLTCAAPYEEARNESNEKGTGNRVKNEHRGPRSVTATSSSYMQARECVGVLWPVSIYRKHHSKKPGAKDLTTMTLSGKKRTGVALLDLATLPEAESCNFLVFDTQ